MKNVLCCFLCIILTGCGFHFRSRQTLPSQIIGLRIQTPRDSLTDKLKEEFNEAGINTKKQTPYSLIISHYDLSTHYPSITSTTSTVTFTHTLTLTASLQYQHKSIAQRKFSINQDTLENSAQLQFSSTPPELVDQFQRDLVQQIYFWLGSQQIQPVLKAQHAN